MFEQSTKTSKETNDSQKIQKQMKMEMNCSN